LRYLFEEYAFDTDRRELHRGTEAVSIAPQVFDLLDYLIRNRERVVTKDDLVKVVSAEPSVADYYRRSRQRRCKNSYLLRTLAQSVDIGKFPVVLA
jgi:DNA-binding response OmpR family regulator